MIYFPNAKINIGLNVTEKRPDGYHNLETVFYPIELQDAIELEGEFKGSSKGVQLRLTGNVLEGSPEDNLVVKAYRLLAEDYPIPPMTFHLHKHIPTGAGLGGGSADAAFTIKAINDMCKLGLKEEEMERYAARLGADCAFFVKNKPVFAEGVGNVFSEIDLSLAGKSIVLVKPDVFISTVDAYSKVVPQRPEVSLKELIKLPLEEWKDCIKNDFETSVFPKYPEIAAIKDKLYDMGAVYASMSGSGSSVFGIFDSDLDPDLNIDEIFAGNFVRQREL